MGFTGALCCGKFAQQLSNILAPSLQVFVPSSIYFDLPHSAQLLPQDAYIEEYDDPNDGAEGTDQEPTLLRGIRKVGSFERNYYVWNVDLPVGENAR